MPYDLFWHGDIGAFDYYLKAYNERIEEEAEKRDYSAHSVGVYVIEALKASYKLLNPFATKKDKDFEYPKHPLSYKPRRTKEDIARGEEAKRMIEEHNRKIEAMMKQKQNTTKGGGHDAEC